MAALRGAWERRKRQNGARSCWIDCKLVALSHWRAMEHRKPAARISQTSPCALPSQRTSCRVSLSQAPQRLQLLHSSRRVAQMTGCGCILQAGHQQVLALWYPMSLEGGPLQRLAVV